MTKKIKATTEKVRRLH